MKIAEFRDKMKNAERANLEVIASELYKQIPKRLKDEEIDSLIEEILINGKPGAKKSKDTVSFDELKSNIDYFLDCAMAGYYFTPNRIIPKSKRSKWRFEVMNYVKQLDKITADDPNSEEAARLYRDIYNVLSYGCGFYLFSTENPFGSIGIHQYDFYERLVAKYFANGYSKEKIKDMLTAATAVYVDPSTLYIELQISFIGGLKTVDMKELAVKIAKERVGELKSKLKTMKKHDNTYWLEKEISELCGVVLGLSIALFEGDAGAEYYMENVVTRDKEVALYKTLDIISVYSRSDDLWIETYEKYIKKGIKPRERLLEIYKAYKSGQK